MNDYSVVSTWWTFFLFAVTNLFLIIYWFDRGSAIEGGLPGSAISKPLRASIGPSKNDRRQFPSKTGW